MHSRVLRFLLLSCTFLACLTATPARSSSRPDQVLALTIIGFSPGGGPASTQVTVRGTGFTGASIVRFNGITASFAVNSDSVITAFVPNTAATGPISVVNGSTATTATNFFVGNAPALFSFSPSGGPVGTSVTIQGNFFTGITAVRFGGAAAAFTVNSNSQITATVPAAAVTGAVEVINPAGTATSGGNFYYLPPTITSLSPGGGPAGRSISIFGTSLAITSQVQFNGVSAGFNVVSNSQVNAFVPGGATSGPVTVSSFAGNASSPVAFYVGNAPAVSSFSPAGGPPGTLVTITGTDLSSATLVTFNGAQAPFVVDAPTQITATVPGTATTGLIAVTNPAGTGTTTANYYAGFAPTVSNVSPSSGPVGSAVTIQGTGFAFATGVQFGGVASQTFNPVSDAQIVAVVPPGAPHGVITVANPAGQGSSATIFHLSPKPTSFSPSAVSAASAVGTQVTVQGWNFTGTTSVTIDGLPATFIVSSDTQLTTTVPALAGTGPIAISTPFGTGITDQEFQVLDFQPPPPSPGAAWPYSPTDNVLVSGSFPGPALNPCIVADSTGGAYVAWVDGRSGPYDIYLQRLTNRGEVAPGWPAGGLVICNAAGYQSSPVAVADQVGGVIVAWLDPRNSSSGDLYAIRIRPDGQIALGWPVNGAPVCLAPNTQVNLAIAPDGANGAYLAWEDYRNGFPMVFAQRMTSEGVPASGWDPNGIQCVTVFSYQSLPSVQLGANQDLYVGWQDGRDGRAYAQHLTATGLVAPNWPAQGLRLGTQGSTHQNCQLVSDGVGGILAFWSDARVSAQHVNADATLPAGWDFNGKYLSPNFFSQYRPLAVPDGQGGAVVVWNDSRNGPQDIYATRMLSDGSIAPGWAVNGTPLCAATDLQDLKSVQPDGYGGAVAFWEDHRFGPTDILAGRIMIGGPGNTGWPTDGAIVTVAPGTQTLPCATSTGRGDFVVAWVDNRNPSLSLLYAQNIGVSGKRGNPEPAVTSVADVPNDQGGKLRVTWTRSYLDSLPSLEIESYGLWRLVDAPTAMRAIKLGARVLASGMYSNARPGALRVIPTKTQSMYWEAVASIHARGQQTYSYVVETLADSTASSPNRETYLLEAYAATGPAYWSAPLVSGASVDNLAPAAPAGFTAILATQNALHWHPNSEADFATYRLYRGTPDFAPGEGSFLVETSDTSYTDASSGGFVYKIVAIDRHGNRSSEAMAGPGTLVSVDNGAPVRFGLAPIVPNPVTTDAVLTLAIPSMGPGSLAVFDVTGRRVKSLASGVLAAGKTAYRWDCRDDAGARVGAGIYFARASFGHETVTRRVVVVE